MWFASHQLLVSCGGATHEEGAFCYAARLAGITSRIKFLHEAEEACTYFAQLAKAESLAHYPSVIFLHFPLPYASGSNWLELLRQNPGLHQIPLALLTFGAPLPSISFLQTTALYDQVISPDTFIQVEGLLQKERPHRSPAYFP